MKSSRDALPFVLLAAMTLAGFALLAWWGAQDPPPYRTIVCAIILLSLPGLLLGCLIARGRAGAPLWALFLVGLGIRALFLGHDPLLSDDVYRYLWDGRVQTAGLTPYGLAPRDAALDAVEESWPAASRVRSRVNHAEIPTIYPPVLELCFRGVAAVGGGLVTWRGLLLVVEMLTAWLMVCALRSRDRDPRWVVLYLWHPLPVVESIWSAHAEGIAVLLLLVGVVGLAGKRKAWGGVALGLGGAAKLLPFGLFAYVWRRFGAVPVATGLLAAGVATLPFWGTDVDAALAGLRAYGESWYFNDAIFRSLGAVTGVDVEDKTLFATQLIRKGLVAAFAVVCLAAAWRGREPYRVALWVTGAFIVLSTTIYPWYLLWVLPFAIIVGSPGWLLLSFTVLLSNGVHIEWHEAGEWRVLGWVRTLEFLPPLLLLLWERRRAQLASLAGAR